MGATLNRLSFSRLRALLLIGTLAATLVPGALHARSVSSVPPLAAPPGTIVNVSTEPQLQAAISQLKSGTTIVLAPGTYQLSKTIYFNGTFSNVGIRGATNNRDDVVIVGAGMTNANYGNVPFGIWTGGNIQGITIANLTIRAVYQHPIIFNAGTQSPRVYNVHLIDAGQQFLKSNPDASGVGAGQGDVEYSIFEYTTTAPSDYTNAIDIHGGANWTIRHNLFRNIVAPSGLLAGPAILAWNHSSGTITEGNTFLNCARGIAYGLQDISGSDHSGGIIRNNFFYRSSGQPGDVAIQVADSPNTQVLNNTVLVSGTYPSPIEYRFAGTTGVVIANNLLDGAVSARDGAKGTTQNNLTTATAAMFVNPATGDLHLKSTATAAIDHGVAQANVTDDWDGDARPSGAAPDIGADEYGGSAPATTYSIAGHARNGSGAAVSGVTVFLAGNTTATATTDATGAYTFGNLPSGGNYSLTASKTGFTVTPAHLTYAGLASDQSSADFSAVSTASAPTVSLSAPASGASFTAPAVITVSATAASSSSTISKVQFYAGTTLIGTDTTSPYSVQWSVSSAGSYAVTAVATDANGSATQSAARTVTVSAASSGTVTATLTAPASGGSYTAPAAISFAANATTTSGSVSKVEFFNGSTLLGTDTSSPYTYTWSNVAAGTYSVSAKATSSSGVTATSAAVNVTVASATSGTPGGGLVSGLTELCTFSLPSGKFGGTTDGFPYGGSAIAFNPSRGTLVMTGMIYDQMTAEITIPACGGTASVVTNFTDDLEGKLHSINPSDSNRQLIGGHLFYNGKLYVSAFSYYDGNGTQVLSHFVRPADLTVKGQVTGPFRAGSMGAGWYSGYMTPIPAEWQSALGGPALTGNCCLSIISRTSYGPSVSSFDPTHLGTANELVGYDQGHQTLGTYGTSGAHPKFNGSTRIKGIVFPQGSSSVIFIGRTGTGNYCYGEASACGDPSNNSKGEHAYPYVMYAWAYDANDLAAVRAGTKQPWQVTPYATWTLPGSGDSEYSGATAYDPATGHIYVVQESATSDARPIVHVLIAH
jgi:uncharacterized protein (DUF2147 family)